MGVIVTVTSLETAPGANVTVALPSALVTLPPAGVMIPWPAGGDKPLAVFAVGSGGVVSQELGVTVVPSSCVDGVVATGVPSPEPEEALPALLVAPSTDALLGQPATLGLLPLLPVPLTAATVTPASPVCATLESIVPLSPVVPSVVGVVVTSVPERVSPPPTPTTACVIAGELAEVEAVVSEEMSADAGLEISPVSFEVLVALVVAVVESAAVASPRSVSAEAESALVEKNV